MKIYQLIEVPFASPLCDEFLQLRYDALRAPLNMKFYATDIEQEWQEYHLLCLDLTDQLLGGLMLRELTSTIIKMRQVVIKKTMRAKGIGKLLVNYSENFAKNQGYIIMSLHARESVHEFYLRLGYRVVGDIFEEVGIPHYRMVKEL